MTRKTRRSLALLLGGMLSVSLDSAWAQRGLPISPRGTAKLNAALDDVRNQRQEAQKLQNAQRELHQREQAVIAASLEEIAAAKRAHRAAGKDLKAAREQASDRIEASLGMKEALAAQSAAQSAYTEAAEPVLQTLRASADYEAVEKQAATAKAQMKEIQADTSIPEADRRAQAAELVGQSLAVSSLERSTLRKQPGVNAARERLEAAQQRVAELRKEASTRAEKDSTVQAAEQAVDAAYAAVKTSEANLGATQSQAASMQRMLQAGVIPRMGDRNDKTKNGDGKGSKKK